MSLLLHSSLLQVLLHTTISEQENRFTLETVAKKLAEKLIRRHPHVFEKKDKTINAEQVTKNWEKIKEEEKGKNSISLIENSILNCPSLISAYKIGKKTEKRERNVKLERETREKGNNGIKGEKVIKGRMGKRGGSKKVRS